jgi:hypothetical protein
LFVTDNDARLAVPLTPSDDRLVAPALSVPPIVAPVATVNATGKLLVKETAPGTIRDDSVEAPALSVPLIVALPETARLVNVPAVVFAKSPTLTLRECGFWPN